MFIQTVTCKRRQVQVRGDSLNFHTTTFRRQILRCYIFTFKDYILHQWSRGRKLQLYLNFLLQLFAEFYFLLGTQEEEKDTIWRKDFQKSGHLFFMIVRYIPKDCGKMVTEQETCQDVTFEDKILRLYDSVFEDLHFVYCKIDMLTIYSSQDATVKPTAMSGSCENLDLTTSSLSHKHTQSQTGYNFFVFIENSISLSFDSYSSTYQ